MALKGVKGPPKVRPSGMDEGTEPIGVPSTKVPYLPDLVRLCSAPT